MIPKYQEYALWTGFTVKRMKVHIVHYTEKDSSYNFLGLPDGSDTNYMFWLSNGKSRDAHPERDLINFPLDFKKHLEEKFSQKPKIIADVKNLISAALMERMLKAPPSSIPAEEIETVRLILAKLESF